MKKLISIILIFSVFFSLIFSYNSYAVTLDAINISINKSIVRPGENVTLKIEFGENLGAYTYDIFFDKNIFEFVSTDGGPSNIISTDTTDKVRVLFFDTTGGSSPRNNMSITFKAKEGLLTSNPTEFTVTAEGLTSPDGSVDYDDITIPIVKNVTVEPEYVDYQFKLELPEKVIKEKENDIKIIYSSTMGRFYEHARLVLEATTPSNATAKLLGIDQAGLEHELIQSGWGDPQGYKIGGKDIEQVLRVRGIFSDVGEYNITLKLIDRHNSDQVIASKTFKVNVSEEKTAPIENTTNNLGQSENAVKQNTNTVAPSKLPKTGNNIYVSTLLIIVIVTGVYVFYNRKK